ncbi:MAG: DUF416 family protein [Sphingobacteriales bacterium]|nr:MAG: DUF416 family protein [Sphingobacteriales bacterium]
MTFQEFDIALKKHLTELSDGDQLALAIWICKKLFYHYHAFYEKTAWGDPDVLLDAVASLDKPRRIGLRGSLVLEIIAEVEEITPGSNRFDDASVAINACSAVHYTLHFLLDGDVEHIYHVCTSLYDTIDEMIQNERVLSEEEIDNHPLMVETRTQLLSGSFSSIASF